MSQQEKMDVLETSIRRRYWDREWAKFATDIAICAGLAEANAVIVLRKVFNLK